jgi:DNA-binding NtrC family response regulator
MLEEKRISDDTQSNYQILIIDDDQDFAASLKLILEGENYHPLLAHSEEEALGVVRENYVDLALLDIRLGQDNGIDLLPKLKKLQPNILCVMITGFGTMETAIQALKYGAYDYLRKPVSPEELMVSLDRGFKRIRQIKNMQATMAKLKRDEAGGEELPRLE